MSQNILSKSQFTAQYQTKSIDLCPENGYIIMGDLYLKSIYKGQEYKLFLDNAYDEYKSNPNDLEGIIFKYIEASKELYQPETTLNLNQIIPVIKDKNYINDISKSLSAKGTKFDESSLVYQQYNEELIIVFAEDQENSIKFISKTDFFKLGLPFDSLLYRSIENLKNKLPHILY